ncbi:hypothetical protein GCM10027592_62030 [Spirosoma flavus]
MPTDRYLALQKAGESIRDYQRRLLLFAIEHRIERPSHGRYVAEQIMQLHLTAQFQQFNLPPGHWKDRQ